MVMAPSDGAPGIGARPLEAAAWAGVIGMLAALAACVWFVRREGLGIGGATFVLLLAGFSTGWGWKLALPVLGLVLFAAFRTPAVFSIQERASLRNTLFTAHDR